MDLHTPQEILAQQTDMLQHLDRIKIHYTNQIL